MKNLIPSTICIAGLIPLFVPAFSQAPQGQLFMHTSQELLNPEGQLGYISYPDEVYHTLDSVNARDMEIEGDNLLTIGRNMYRYDLSTGLKTDSISDIFGKSVEIWNDRLVTMHDSVPYLRVYRSDFSLDFVIDTPVVFPYSADLFVAGNKAFIAYGDSIQVIDLQTKTAIPLKHNNPTPIGLGGYSNVYLANGKILVNFDWYTALPRVTVVEIDTVMDSVRFVAFGIFGSSYFDPVPAGTKIYMGWFLGYYDFVQDSFLTNDTLNMFAIAWDELTQSLFAMNIEFGAPAIEVSYIQNDTFSVPVTVPGYIGITRFRSGNRTPIDNWGGIDNPIEVFPNPTSGRLFLTSDKFPGQRVEVALFSPFGSKLFSRSWIAGDVKETIDLSPYPEGYYLLNIHLRGQSFYRKIWIQH
ncbi:MAG: T9SS type A sorting domain-containing protein [Bacteroidia bacterium]|nr:T9SS type A sorting domain-containing protein [Bacteroidia bacterium]